jgi:hypothetical protein
MFPSNVGAIVAELPINLIGRRFAQITAETKKDAMRIALSAKRLSVYIRVQKGISYSIKMK